MVMLPYPNGTLMTMLTSADDIGFIFGIRRFLNSVNILYNVFRTIRLNINLSNREKTMNWNESRDDNYHKNSGYVINKHFKYLGVRNEETLLDT